ncbi:MAG TPA: hypothetical protein VLQ79_11600 [Myxococcaceae bacterium]|nr:hypothetical protein [Myxococcaceae bacterium]
MDRGGEARAVPGAEGRDTYRFEGNDRYRFHIENSSDGGKSWVKFMEGVYRRRPGRAPA